MTTSNSHILHYLTYYLLLIYNTLHIHIQVYQLVNYNLEQFLVRVLLWVDFRFSSLISETVQLLVHACKGYKSRFNTRDNLFNIFIFDFFLIFGNMESRKIIVMLVSMNVDSKVFNLTGKSVILARSVFANRLDSGKHA